MNRAYDLKEIMPSLINSANRSPPVEILVLDYNSTDDLAEFIGKTMSLTEFNNGSGISYYKYDKRDYYHMAHARNLACLAAKGKYIISYNTDMFMTPLYLHKVRDAIKEGYVWTFQKHIFVGVIGFMKEEFIKAGGFDERFEFYGKEDRDIIARFDRRGCRGKQLPHTLMDIIYTPSKEKVKNYRLKLSRHRMGKIAKKIYFENIENNVMVANEGEEWGKWE
jgi:hypothetical protein